MQQEAVQELTRIQRYTEQLFDKALNTGVKVIMAFVLFIAGMYIIKLILKGIDKSLKKAGVDKHNIGLISSISKVILYIVLFGLILGYFGIQTASIVAVVTSAGVTIGLAFQGSLSNFAAGFLIMIIKPFKLGDYIILPNSSIEGKVNDIGMFFTRVTTVDNKANIIPNSVLLNASITNVTFHDKRMLEIIVGVSYDSDIDKVKDVLNTVVQNEENVIKTDDILIFVSELNSNSIDMGVRVFVQKENYWATKWRLLENIKKSFDENSIEIPFNQMDVHVDNK